MDVLHREDTTRFEAALRSGDVASVQRHADLYGWEATCSVFPSKTPTLQATTSASIVRLLLCHCNVNGRHPTTGSTALHCFAAMPPDSPADAAPLLSTASLAAALAREAVNNALTIACGRSAETDVHPTASSSIIADTPSAAVEGSTQAVEGSAAAEGSAALVSLLLEHGADPTLTNVAGHTALIVAARAGNSAALDAFFCFGIQIPVEALHHAAICGHLATVRYLLEVVDGRRGHVFTAFSRRSDDGTLATPLHCAAGAGHLPVVDYLLERCCGGDQREASALLADITDAGGRNVLHAAAEGQDGNERMLQRLLACSAALAAAADRGGRTALESALRAGRRANAAFLLSFGHKQPKVDGCAHSKAEQTASALWLAHKLAPLVQRVEW